LDHLYVIFVGLGLKLGPGREIGDLVSSFRIDGSTCRMLARGAAVAAARRALQRSARPAASLAGAQRFSAQPLRLVHGLEGR
jgi:hypothetical protein